MPSILDLKEERYKIVQNISAIVSSTEGRDPSEEEQAQLDAMFAKEAELKDQISSEENSARKARANELMNGLKSANRKITPAVSTRRETSQEEYTLALRNWLLFGTRNYRPSDEAMELGERLGMSTSRKSITIDMRALGRTTGSSGGYTVPTGSPTLVEHLKYFCPIREHCDVVVTSDGNAIPFTKNDDTGNVGELIAENAAHNEQDTAFSTVSLGAYPCSSKMIRVSQALIRDNVVDLPNYLGRKLGERIGRLQEQLFVAGTGSSQPNGIVTASSAGKTSFDVSQISSWLALEHSVDPFYRRSAKWLFHDQTLLAIKSMVDDAGRPLWLPDYVGASPGTFLGYPIVISQSMEYTGASKKVAVFGDLTQYQIRDVGTVELRKSEDRYFEYHQVVFLATLHSDGNYLGPSIALKHGITAAS